MGPFASLLFLLGLSIQQRSAEASKASRTVVDFQPYAMIGRIMNMKDSSLGPNVLNDGLDQENTFQTIEAYTSESSYKFISTTSDATRIINKNSDFALRTGLGLVPSGASASGSYFKSSLDRENFAELLFNINVKTRTRSLVNHGGAINNTRCQVSASKGTHIVTGIQYGASCLLSLRAQAATIYEKETVNGDMKAMFGISSVSIGAEGSVKELLESMKSLTNVTVFTFCNLPLETFPSTPVDGIKLVDDFLKLMSENNKDGVPVEMELTHISEFSQCGSHNVAWQDSKNLEAYFDQTSELLEDVTVAHDRLMVCSEIMSSASDAAAEATKLEAKTLSAKMKKVNYELRKFIAQVDPTAGPQQFDRLHGIYGDGAASVNLYDHNHWRVKVFWACRKLNKLPRMFPAVEKALSANCVYDPSMTQRAGTRAHGSKKKVTDVFDGDANTYHQFSENWFVTLFLKDGVQNVKSVEVVFDMERAIPAGMKIDMYLTNKKVTGIMYDEDKETTYEYKHSGTITVPEVNTSPWWMHITEQLRSIKVEMEKYSDIQYFLRLEGNAEVRISEINVGGERCLTEL